MRKINDQPIDRYRKPPPLMIVLILLCSGLAIADEDDRLELSVGGYFVNQYDSVVSLTETNVGVGISFSPRDTLGLDGEQSVFRIDGRYRFKSNHALTFSWYRITANSAKTLLDDIEWVDENGDTVTIPTGTSVRSSLGYDIYKIGYLWSFYRSDKVELTAGAGLHLADIGLELAVEAGLFDSQLRTATSDVPMPVASFGLDYSVTPKLDWYLKSQVFGLDIGEWRGLYSDFQLGVTYQLFDHVGAGVAIGSNSLEVVREYSDEDVRFDFDNRVSGVYVFLSANF
jgi:hypothetical protein